MSGLTDDRWAATDDQDRARESGFDAFVRAMATAPAVEPELLMRQHELARGDVLLDGCYQVEAELGRGGLGTVYRGADRELGRPVAIKVLRVDAALRPAQLTEQLQREALATARLNHVNIVTVHRFGVWRNLPYLILELIDGEPLADRLRRGPLALDESIAITTQILAGLAHAHEAGVLHRDLSPRNVLVRRDGTVKLLDFGLSSLRVRATPPVDALPGSTALGAGTPGFMPPEQRRGEPSTPASDLWAVGALFARMVGGEPERAGVEPAITALPRGCAAVVARACAEQPADRFATAGELRAAILQLAPRRRWGRVAAATAATIALLATATAVGLSQPSGPPPAGDLSSMLETRSTRARPAAPERLDDAVGRWLNSGDTTAFAEIQPTGDGGYTFIYSNAPSGTNVSRAYWHNDGVLRPVRVDDTLYLAGVLHSVPGWSQGPLDAEVELRLVDHDHMVLTSVLSVPGQPPYAVYPEHPFRRVAP